MLKLRLLGFFFDIGRIAEGQIGINYINIGITLISFGLGYLLGGI